MGISRQQALDAADILFGEPEPPAPPPKEEINYLPYLGGALVLLLLTMTLKGK